MAFDTLPILDLPGLDTTIGFAMTPIDAPTGDLFPEEADTLSHRALPARRAEFRAGRAVAHRAMQALGLAVSPVLAAPTRAPIWPRGLVGSISHDATRAVAVVARARDHRALGIDVEPATPLDRELWPEVLTAGELATLDAHGIAPGLAAKLIFCAKEAVYKAQFPLTGRVLGFHEVDVTLDLAIQRFAATGPDLPAGLNGSLLIEVGMILCLVRVPA